MISFNELVLRYHENGYNNKMMMASSPSLVNVMDGADDDSMVRSSESHKEAERRRRERINSHLSTLRTLLPTSPVNAGKATLLASVVQRVKELKRTADDEVAQRLDGERFPREVDEGRLMSCQEGKVMKATLCCEDRPGLNRDLAHAIESVRVRAVRVEMVAVGGRMKIEVVMKWSGGGGGDFEGGFDGGGGESVFGFSGEAGSGLRVGFVLETITKSQSLLMRKKYLGLWGVKNRTLLHDVLKGFEVFRR